MSECTVAIAGSHLTPDADPLFGDIGLNALDTAGIGWRYLPITGQRLLPTHTRAYDAILLMDGTRVDALSFNGDVRVGLLSRFGAGYDRIDLAACDANGVLVANAPDGVRTPMADAAIASAFALAHNIVIKDRLVRDGRWDDRGDWHGRGLTGAVIGIVGFGNIAVEAATKFRALGLDVLAHSRNPRRDVAEKLGVTLVPLARLIADSDYIVLLVPGGQETAGLIDDRALRAMKPTAQLINLSRGSVVDETALVEALGSGRLAGAFLDVFEKEPLNADHPLTRFENVILAPHSLGWTTEFIRATGRQALEAIVQYAGGTTPRHVLMEAS